MSIAYEVSDDEITAALSGAPGWIKPERVRDTLNTLQPYYPHERLSAAEAVEILLRVVKLYEVLSGIDASSTGATACSPDGLKIQRDYAEENPSNPL